MEEVGDPEAEDSGMSSCAMGIEKGKQPRRVCFVWFALRREVKALGGRGEEERRRMPTGREEVVRIKSEHVCMYLCTRVFE